MKSLYLALFITVSLSYNLSAQTISTFAGTGTAGYTGNGGQATAARFSRPTGLAVDNAHNVYVADGPNYRVRKITPAGIVTVIAGNGTAGYSGDGGPATAAAIGGLDTAGGVVPLCIAVNRGNIYIADGSHHVIRKIDTAGIITTIAGTGTAGFSGDNGAATAARLRYPQGISFDKSNNLYVADCYNHRIRRINGAGVITTTAGTGTAGYTGNGAAATAARLRYPYDAAFDTASGNLYIADLENNVIRKIDSNKVISTFAGTTVSGFTGDNGPATAALLDHPTVVRFDGMGNVYVSDNHNSYVRRIDDTGGIAAFAGNGIYGFSGDNGPATAAMMRAPWGLAIDNDEFVYISDSANARVRKVSFIARITGPSTVCSGATIALSDTTVGGAWSSSNNSLATVSSTGIVSAIHPGTITITYNTAIGKATKMITITGPTLSGLHTLPAVCSGDSVLYAATSATSGVNFAWQRNYLAGISSLGTSGTGDIAEVLVNTTTSSKTVTYMYTLTTPGCLNKENVQVTIRPVPWLSSTRTPAPICDSSYFNYTPITQITGDSLAWSRGATPGISNPPASGNGNIYELLNSTDTLPVTVKYVYVMVASGTSACTNIDTVTVIVNPCHPASVTSPEIGGTTIDLYPNPAHEQFSVTRSGMIKGQMTVTVYNITGKLLLAQTTAKNTIDISVAGFGAGMYYCQITVDGEQTMRKLMIR